MQNIEFVSENERAVFARAQLGEDVMKFLNSAPGKYLHGRVKEDLERVKCELLLVDTDYPWGRRKARRLRETAAHCERFMKYCVDAITDGEVAYSELDAAETNGGSR